VHEEYEKLRLYDAPTFAQPSAGFACHATPQQLCHGWAVVGSSRGHEFELLALRLQWPAGGIPEAAIPLFASGDEAADHGQADVDHPGEDAQASMLKLVWQHGRLKRLSES
jgi:hypothetical protein